MSQAGTDLAQFDPGGRTVFRRDGALRLGDGTLAGADPTMDAAVRKLTNLGFGLSAALEMATRAPGRAIRHSALGHRLRIARRSSLFRPWCVRASDLASRFASSRQRMGLSKHTKVDSAKPTVVVDG